METAGEGETMAEQDVRSGEAPEAQNQEEEALRESEERYKSLFQKNYAVMLLIDPDSGAVVDANPAASTYYGWTHEELLKKKIEEINTLTTEEVHAEMQLAREEKRNHFIFKHRRANGSVRDVEVYSGPLALMGKALLYSIVHDITERKKAEEALQESEARLRAILDATPFPVALVDVKDDTINFWSRSALTLFGHTASTAGEWYQIAYPDPDYRGEVISRWKTSLEEARLSGQWVNTGEYRVACSDGSARICELYAAFVSDSLVVTFNDITERKQAEQALTASHSALLEAQAIAHIGSWSMDATTRMFTWSKEMYAIHGLQQGTNVSHETYLELICPEDRKRVFEVMGLAMTNRQQEFVVDYCITRPDGSERSISLTGKTVLDGSNAVTGLRGTMQDITERKQAEAYGKMGREILQILNEPDTVQGSLQRILLTLHKATGFNAVGIRLQDGDDFPYFVQEGLSRDFLLTENTLIERKADGGVCRDCDGRVSLECTCGLVVSGKTDPLNPLFTRGGSFWTNDSLPLLDLTSDEDPRHNARNRCIHTGYASIALVPIRNKDGIVGLIHLNDCRKGRLTLRTVELLEGIAAHIGEALLRKQAENALHESEAKFRALVENLQVGVVAHAPDTSILLSNPEASEILGLSPDQMYGKKAIDPDWCFIREDGTKLPAAEYPVNRALAEEMPISGLILGVIRPDRQSPTWIECKSRRLLGSEGELVQIIATFSDITERKQAEAEKEAIQAQLVQSKKLEVVGQLAGGVAHNFNNLLTGILGSIEIARMDTPPTSPAASNLDMARDAAVKAAGLARQLLAYGRNAMVVPVAQMASSLVESALDLICSSVPSSVKVVRELSPDAWEVLADSSQLTQVLLELINNARESMEDKGAITVRTGNVTVDEAYVATRPFARTGEFVVISVADTGPGIDPAMMARLFEPFATTRQFGRGLGLPTVFGSIKQAGGWVDVQSEPGAGTTVDLYLPRHTPAA